MAVGIKNTPEIASASFLDHMPVAALAGTAYLLGSLGIVFYLLPSLWDTHGWTGNASAMVRGLLQFAALTGLVVFGARLLGPKAAHGVRAGIFIGFVGFLLILLLTRWASLWLEYGSFDRGWFNYSVGATLTTLVGVVLLIAGGRLFLRPATERFLMRFEEQGWFTARPYKAMQGQRVRRGTIFGILVLVGAGIYTMLAHGTLRKGEKNWGLNVPFTGRVTLESKGDVPADVLTRYIPDWESRLADRTLIVDRFTLQEINQSVAPTRYVKIIEPGASKFRTNEVVERGEYKAEEQKLKDNGETTPQIGVPDPATGALAYRTFTLLPALQFTIPLLLLAAALWLAWRVVNVPAFADFLIATEAEMNKVSWTTQRRLIQDTIVVLVTVVLMAFYLFSMDVVWKSVLSWPPIGVLKISEKSDATQPVEDRPW